MSSLYNFECQNSQRSNRREGRRQRRWFERDIIFHGVAGNHGGTKLPVYVFERRIISFCLLKLHHFGKNTGSVVVDRGEYSGAMLFRMRNHGGQRNYVGLGTEGVDKLGASELGAEWSRGR